MRTLTYHIIAMYMMAATAPRTSSANYEACKVNCPTEKYVQLGKRTVLQCEDLANHKLLYWINSTQADAPVSIQKENGEVKGAAYLTGEFDIDSNGSLVINNVTLDYNVTFRLKVVNSSSFVSVCDITVIVYVKSTDPIPLIPECSGQSTCILKVDSHRVISCTHGESRPAMEVSWFLRDGREDRLLNATVNQMLSADAVTFTTSAQLAIEEIPIDANMNQLLVLVCKSVQAIPGMKGTERKILLDNSVDDPFRNAENLDHVYAFKREEDFKIECQSEIDTANNVLLWMYKSLSGEDSENILYSAYGEVAFTTKGEAGFNITDDGALLIKEVNLQHVGYYACEHMSSSKNTKESFVHDLEVIVLPKPPRIVVKGCEPFQPYQLSAQEAETITCTVNGVRPQVDLSIVTYSMNAAVTNTTVRSHIEDGLFYTTVAGQVDVSEAICGKNVTVICQAQGPAAYGFMSNAFVTIPVDGNECIDSSTDAVLPNDDGSNNNWLKFLGILLPVLLIVVLVVWNRKKILCKWQHTIESKPHQNGSEREAPELGRLTEGDNSLTEESGV